MKRHLLKLMWHRKRANALVVAEIFVSFLVLFVVIAFAILFGLNYRKPLGYDIDGVWRVGLQMNQAAEGDSAAARYESILAEVGRMREVQRAAGIDFPPYSMGAMVMPAEVRGRPIMVETNAATDGLADVLGLSLVSGRWFGPEDDAANWKPVVINRELAIATFGREDAAGERLPFMEERRVVGVVADFRKGGELEGTSHYMFTRARVGPSGAAPPQLLLKMRDGVDAAFEEELVRRMSAVAPGWSFSVEPMARMRASALRLQLIPLLIGATIALFLVLMVALGLTGIMWQTVTRRTRELGLRRAVGASDRGVYGQIVFETVILAAAGILVGLAVALQLPLMGVADFFGSRIYFAAVLLSSGTIVALAVLCGLYPGWLASRVEPAEALRYE